MDRDKSFLFSSKCKYLAGFSLVVVLIEIYFIQVWESTDTGFAQTLQSQSYLRRMKMEYNCIDPAEPGRNSSTASPCAEPVVAPTTDLSPASKVSKAVQKYLTLRDQLEEHLKKATEKKIILVWVPMFDDTTPISINAKKCGNCEVTFDHDKISDERTGALLFHFDKIRKNSMPSTRNPKHLYIYWARESSATVKIYRGHQLQLENDVNFNDTMTYRRDSGFCDNYNVMDNLIDILESDITPEKLLQEKTKLAVAVVSNCGDTPGARIRMRKLNEIIGYGFALERFGRCFHDKSFANGNLRETLEFHLAVRQYKFYFSFENSFHCKDYITEKFCSNALGSLAVPVVWGAEKSDYEAVAPTGSFIYADDFASMKELADYLNYLDSNDTAYMEYLRWVVMKPEQIPQYGRSTRYCQICRALHGINIDDIYNPEYDESTWERPLFSDGVVPRTVQNLIDWMYGEENRECFSH